MRFFRSNARRGRVTVALVGAILCVTTAWSQDDQPGSTEGVSVLARGPVHEAFADPFVEKPAASPVVPKQPPANVEELPPTQKPEGENVEWIPGYWAWDEDSEDFLWVSGVWRDIPPGRQWVPGYWTSVEHGAQWVPGYWIESGRAEVQYLPPPPESLESGPSVAAPGDNYIYTPGCFMYYENRYVWRPGFWIAPHPGWCWVPARYTWTPLGYVFVDGRWDYLLHRRGVLFAPVHIQRGLLGRGGWHFRPSYVVRESALVNALFVRPSFGHYYFGDYFDSRYDRRGFVPWVDFRIGRRVVDPLFAQYRSQYREPDRWEKSLRAVYGERRSNVSARPPIDLARQEARRGSDRDKDAVLTPLSRLDRESVKLTQVPDSAREDFARRIQAQRLALEERQKGESPRGAGSKGSPNEQPRVIRRTPAPSEGTPPRRVETPPLPKNPAAKESGKGAVSPRPAEPGAEPKKPRSVEPKGEPRPQPKAEPRPKSGDSPTVPKTEPRPEPPRQPKAEPRPLPKPEPRPQPKTEPNPRPNAVPRAEPRPPAGPKAPPSPQPKPKSKDD